MSVPTGPHKGIKVFDLTRVELGAAAPPSGHPIQSPHVRHLLLGLDRR
jgi:hypothetical protein